MKRVHTTDLFRCTNCGTRDTVAPTAFDDEVCVCCMADLHPPHTKSGALVSLALSELRERGEDLDGNKTRPVPPDTSAQEIVDEVAPRLTAVIADLRTWMQRYGFTHPNASIAVITDELAQCATMLTLAVTEEDDE